MGDKLRDALEAAKSLVKNCLVPGGAGFLRTRLRFLVARFLRFLLAGEEDHVVGSDVGVIPAAFVVEDFGEMLSMDDSLR